MVVSGGRGRALLIMIPNAGATCAANGSFYGMPRDLVKGTYRAGGVERDYRFVTSTAAAGVGQP
jgi:hypothetical protein